MKEKIANIIQKYKDEVAYSKKHEKLRIENDWKSNYFCQPGRHEIYLAGLTKKIIKDLETIVKEE